MNRTASLWLKGSEEKGDGVRGTVRVGGGLVVGNPIRNGDFESRSYLQTQLLYRCQSGGTYIATRYRKEVTSGAIKKSSTATPQNKAPNALQNGLS